MSLLIKNAYVLDPIFDVEGQLDVLIESDSWYYTPTTVPAQANVFDATGLHLFPGLTDLHVHFREPGFEYKETLQTGSQAALAGGVTAAVVMPNTNPVLDRPELVRAQIDQAREHNLIQIYVAAAATKGLLGETPTDVSALKAAGAVAITDDGKPVMNDKLMLHLLKECAKHDMLFMQHAEDLRLSKQAPLNEGVASHTLGLPGQSTDAEGSMVERDIALVEQTGARYHVLHISTKRALDAVRAAKKKGLRVTCEATPHHLLLNEAVCMSGDSNKKMNPPLRSEDDRQALIAALMDGTIDAIASDHAPHSIDEKSCGFSCAPFGVVGLETLFSALLQFVHAQVISLHQAVSLCTVGPQRVLFKNVQQKHPSANFVLVDTKKKYTVTEDTLFGRSKNSAFLGRELTGQVVATFLRGELKFRR